MNTVQRLVAFFVMVLVAAVAVLANASEARAKAKQPRKTKYVVQKRIEPCGSDFEIKVSVRGSEQFESSSESAGVQLKYTQANGRGVASRMHVATQSGAMSNASCKVWQKDYWPLYRTMALENKRPERARMTCYNIGSIEYKSGARTEKHKFCLGDARRDALTYAFRRFYDGTDGMVPR